MKSHSKFQIDLVNLAFKYRYKMLNRIRRMARPERVDSRVAPRCTVIPRSNNWFGAFVNGVSPKPKTKEEPASVQSETTAEVQHAPSSRLMAPQRNRDFLEAKQVSLYQMFDSDEMR